MIDMRRTSRTEVAMDRVSRCSRVRVSTWRTSEDLELIFMNDLIHRERTTSKLLARVAVTDDMLRSGNFSCPSAVTTMARPMEVTALHGGFLEARGKEDAILDIFCGILVTVL